MNLLSWNCRGLGNPRTVRVLGDVVKSLKPTFLFLSETKLQGEEIKELSERYGFVEYYAVDKVGQGGGLEVMWKASVKCRVVDSSLNHIDVIFLEKNSSAWRLSCFYGMPEITRRQDSWNLLRQLATRDDIPWSVFGDFNDLLYAMTKKENTHALNL